MSEEKRSFWSRLLSGYHDTEREEKVLEYIVHRTESGVGLSEVIKEDYVRRNATSSEIDDIINNPRLVRSARRRMEADFRSGDLDPSR